MGSRKGICVPVKTEWWVAGVVICLERGADLHMAQLIPLPLTVSRFSKIQIGLTFLVPAHAVVPEKGPLTGVCVYELSGLVREMRTPHTLWLGTWLTLRLHLLARTIAFS